MSYPRFTDIARAFAPGWFAAVMGTGVFAITTHSLSLRWPWLALPAEMLHWFNSGLFLVLAVPWLTRWLAFRPAAMQTMMHPVQANFYPTFSIALLVLAAQWLTFSPHIEVALAIWWLGVLVHFVFSFAVVFIMFRGACGGRSRDAGPLHSGCRPGCDAAGRRAIAGTWKGPGMSGC
jgi:tellurite resistance protein TehA-like permease